jgi:hypothetical protein
MSSFVFRFWHHLRWTLVHDETQRFIGYLPPKMSRILIENWLSGAAAPGVGDIDVKLICGISELFATVVSESFRHRE